MNTYAYSKMPGFRSIRRLLSTRILQKTSKVSVLISKETDIYFNIALENYLQTSYGNSTIDELSGRNQNVWSECNLENVRRDNVNIVRRFTGGGAVYQDLGNSCFTFISPTDNYSFENNSEIICSAVGELIGQKCEPRGRNDLCINELKFSGTAFRVLPNAALHHGTLLINLNKACLDKYLTPDKSKLEKHNVQSTKSRVTNLAQYKAGITYKDVFDAIVNKFVEHYDANETKVRELGLNTAFCQDPEFNKIHNQLKDEKWIFGDKVLDTQSYNHRFDFGNIQLVLDVHKGVAEKVWIFSDCLDTDFIHFLISKFNEAPLEHKACEFVKALNNCDTPNWNTMIADVKQWIVSALPE